MWPCLLVSFCLEILIAESSAFYSSESLCCVCHSKIIITHNILFMGFSRQEYWSGLPFPSPVDHILSELSTMTCPSWVILRGMAHSFIELHKAVIHAIISVSFLWLWFLFWRLWDVVLASSVWWMRTRGFWKLPDEKDWLWEHDLVTEKFPIVMGQIVSTVLRTYST